MQFIFDSHAHYDDSAFDEDRAELLASLPENGVCGAVTCGCDIKSSEAAVSLAKKHSYIYAAAGFHPETVGGDMQELLAEIKNILTQNEKCVAVGEIGLDYHYEDGAPAEIQREWFEAQIKLAKELNLPVIVHDRDAHADTLEILRKYRPEGVVHCFSGSAEMAKEVLELGMYIGLGGAVTFKNAKKPVKVAREVPIERLLLETDCPYMAPVPMRGKRCDSSMICYTAEKIAEGRGMEVSELLRQTAENARRLFKI